jgi:hypothetical protein
VQDSEPSSSEKRAEIENADQAFFDQEGNITDNFNEVDANVHRIVENPLAESTGPNVTAEPLPEDVKWAQQKTSNRKSEESDS